MAHPTGNLFENAADFLNRVGRFDWGQTDDDSNLHTVAHLLPLLSAVSADLCTSGTRMGTSESQRGDATPPLGRQPNSKHEDPRRSTKIHEDQASTVRLRRSFENGQGKNMEQIRSTFMLFAQSVLKRTGWHRQPAQSKLGSRSRRNARVALRFVVPS
jgi:hypothetical protein